MTQIQLKKEAFLNSRVKATAKAKVKVKVKYDELEPEFTLIQENLPSCKAKKPPI